MITKAATQISNLTDRRDRQALEVLRAAKTAELMEEIGEEVVLYKQCGRMYLSQPKAEIKEFFEKSKEKKEKEVKTCNETVQYFEKQRNAAETNLREMMGQLEQQMAARSRRGGGSVRSKHQFH